MALLAVGLALVTYGVLAIEMVRLFQVELEHYEKLEGSTMSLEGKANRLSAMIRGNLQMAMQGLAVVPIFAGFDLGRSEGRIFSYDVTGGRYEEHSFHSVGSGSTFARSALKKKYTDDVTETDAVRLAVDALYDAMDVFVLASHREGFPRAAMEAAAMGLPIVATEVKREWKSMRQNAE